MDRALRQFVSILTQFGCSATFPTVGVLLNRNPRTIKMCQDQGIEFAIHGYRHTDYCQLSRREQSAQLALAMDLFSRIGIRVQGFRGPYLHANRDTLLALQQQRLAYDSSQGLAWDVVHGCETPAYHHVLSFYGALSASDYPSLPSLEGSLVRLPYNLPDDESLVHRLSLNTTDQVTGVWLAILHRSYELGELFTLGLHPERIFICQEPLTAVLSEARRLDPAVWIARLDEIVAWWRARSQATAEIIDAGNGRLRVNVTGPSGTTVLARGVDLDVPTRPWADGYQKMQAMTFIAHAPVRPFIGLSPTVCRELSGFLRQQGYLVEISQQPQRYAHYLDQTHFTPEDERQLLARIEETNRPLVRLGRWPNGARSALAITGDVDALTLRDFGLRFFGK
jgi:peptidoglycan/xylan/chitin deacetylase (PgdA/CDA1 family)